MTLKIKSSKLKPSADSPAPGVLNPDPQQSNVVVADRFKNPALSAETTGTRPENFKWAAIIAGITTVIFIVLLVMQWFDLQALQIA